MRGSAAPLRECRRKEACEPVFFSREREHFRTLQGGGWPHSGEMGERSKLYRDTCTVFPGDGTHNICTTCNVSTYCTQLKDQRAVWSLRSVIAEIIVICSLGRRSRAPLLCVSSLDIGPSSRSCGSVPSLSCSSRRSIALATEPPAPAHVRPIAACEQAASSPVCRGSTQRHVSRAPGHVPVTYRSRASLPLRLARKRNSTLIRAQ